MTGRADGHLVDVEESADRLTVTLRRPTTHHLDAFVRLRSAPDLLLAGVFPNAKEITESMAAFEAVRRHGAVRLDDPEVSVLAVGDGATPRTATLFAHRTAWRAHAVDPALGGGDPSRWDGLDRVSVHPVKVKDLDAVEGWCVVVAVHAHVRLPRALADIAAKGGVVRCVVQIPCCGFVEVPDLPGFELVAQYLDWGVWSQHREVRVWRRTA